MSENRAHRWIASFLHLRPSLGSLLFLMGPLVAGPAAAKSALILDCRPFKDLTAFSTQSTTVYLPDHGFNADRYFKEGKIDLSEFERLTHFVLKKEENRIRLRTAKNDEVVIYLVTSIPLAVFRNPEGAPIPSPQLLTDPFVWIVPPRPDPGRPITVTSRPLTISYLPTARFVIQEQRRQGELESGNILPESFMASELLKPLSPNNAGMPGKRTIYCYAFNYRLKCTSASIKLSFLDQSGNQQQVTTLLTGPSQNWFLTAGGPLFSANLDPQDGTGTPLGLYVGLNWSPNEIDDPGFRWLIVNLMDVNTTNPSAGIGIAGLGVGFPKMNDFIPLSTLAVTETIFFNMNSSKFQLLTLVTYDVSDIFQFLKL